MSFSVDQLIADCLAAVADGGSHAGVAVDDVVGRAVSNPSAIERALGRASDQPLMSTWYRSDELTVLNIIWPPHVSLTAHDHLMWASIGLYGGREDNALFRELPDGQLELRRTKTLTTSDTVVLGADTIHSVTNPTKEWTGAIHVYGGDFFRDDRRAWSSEDHTVEPFDAAKVRALLDAAADEARHADG